MARDLNQCNFIGRLGRDVETRSFPNGDQVANVSIAVGSSWTDKSTGEKRERTEWVSLVFTGPLAGVAGQYLRKGSRIFVSGEMQTRKWQDRDGNDRYTTEVRVRDLQMLDGRRDSDDSQPQAPRQAPRQATPRQQAPQQQSMPTGGGGSGGFDDMNDDIPFVTNSMTYDMEPSKLRRMRRYQ